MATSSPGQSIHLKSPRSPRKLPQLPQLQQIPISGQRSPTQLSVIKSPGTPLVFEFPPEYYPETPNTNFDFDNFGRACEAEQRGSRSPSYYGLPAARSPKSPKGELLHSPGRKSPIFQLCDPRKNLGKTMSYPPRSPISGPTMPPTRSPSSSSFGPKSPKLFDRRRNSCFGLATSKGPMSPTIVTPTSHGSSSPKHFDFSLDQPQQKSPCRDAAALYKCNGKAGSSDGSFKKREKSTERDSSSEKEKGGKMGGHLNRSQGCLEQAGRTQGMGNGSNNGASEKNMSRRSTSDLTEIGDADTEVTLLSSPRRRGSMKGGLAYLASRRGSRDSQCSNLSNVSNEDVGPLNFSAHPRGRQRRTSNFLELPVPDHIRPRVHSLPEKAYNPRAGDDLYRLRAFSITHKGVINRGDSIISRRSRSNTSVNSSR
ncbi:hypothetical protein KM043_002883 [Ampulex compressa]|nr:hypothetical protein KM043_002883 [Ampulex compressa]